jgi:hypothetical protein
LKYVQRRIIAGSNHSEALFKKTVLGWSEHQEFSASGGFATLLPSKSVNLYFFGKEDIN